MIEFILFDFDGTLMNTNKLIVEALGETVKNVLNREMTEQDLLNVYGNYLDEQMKYFSKEKYEEMVAYYRQYYRTHRDNIELFPDVDNLLKDLKRLGYKIGITSAKSRAGILHGLDLFGLKQYIDHIVSSTEVKNNKPHPESVYRAMDYFQCKKDNLILIGDSPYDIQCGINAGIKTALVSWTIFPKERFNGMQLDYIINKPSDILEIVNR